MPGDKPPSLTRHWRLRCWVTMVTTSQCNGRRGRGGSRIVDIRDRRWQYSYPMAGRDFRLRGENGGARESREQRSCTWGRGEEAGQGRPRQGAPAKPSITKHPRLPQTHTHWKHKLHGLMLLVNPSSQPSADHTNQLEAQQTYRLGAFGTFPWSPVPLKASG